MRPQDEGKLSTNWLEFFDGDYEDNLKNAIVDFRSVRSTANSAIFGIAKVGVLYEKCDEKNASKAKVVHKNKKKATRNFSHATINDIPENDNDLMQCLSSEVFDTFVMAKNF